MADNCKLGSLIWNSLGEPETAVSRAWICCEGVIALTYVTSLLSGNYSQVDKLWSIVPFVYAWILVVPGDARTLLMAVLATLWGLRLTYNFNRRGGYHWPPWKGDEDYRWAYLQKGFYIPVLTNRVIWHIFNFVFISGYQNILLLLITAPSIVANIVASNKNICFPGVPTTLNFLDGVATILFLGFLVLETIADNTQYVFQTEKYRRKNAGETLEGDYADGYCQSGVYAYIRKPNYTGEQGMWCSYFLFSVATLWPIEEMSYVDCIFNCSLLGAVLLVLLFQGSGDMTERITISKYPTYTQYQERVPRYLPNLFSGPVSQKRRSN